MFLKLLWFYNGLNFFVRLCFCDYQVAVWSSLTGKIRENNLFYELRSHFSVYVALSKKPIQHMQHTA